MSAPGAAGGDGRVAGQDAAAGRDALTAGRDMYVNVPAAGGGDGRGVLWPPLGRLPGRVRGRDRVLERLTGLLAAPDGLAHVLSGLGGTGKSTVALRVAEVAMAQGRRVWWVPGGDAESLTAGMLLLAESLGADAGRVQGARAGLVPACDVLWPLLEADPGWLLVIDNADDVGALTVSGRALGDGNGWVRGSRSGLVVVTTRDSDPAHWGRAVELHPVGWLTDSDGGLVLRDLAPEAGTAAEAESLAGRLGGLALALHHAGSHLAMPFARLRTFTDYRQAWEEGAAPGVLAGTLSDRDVVTGTWRLSLDQLDRSGFPQARNLFDVLSWFAAPIPIPVQDLDHDVLGRICGERGAAAVGPGLQALLSAGLIETRLPSTLPGSGQTGRSGLMVHPLVAETVRYQDLARGTAPATASVAVDLLAQATDHLQAEEPADWPAWIAWLPHLEELLTHASGHLSLQDLATVAGSAADGVMALLWAGSYPAALKVAETARQYTERLGPEHLRTLDLIDRQADAYLFVDDSAKAERLYRELLPIRERVLGPEHPATLVTRNQIAHAVAGQGNHAEAERLYRELLPIRERVLGPEHPATLVTRYSIAGVVASQGNHAEAERLYRELLPIEERVRGPEHPDTLVTRNQIARAVAGQGNHAEAERLYRELLPIRERVLGPEHPATLVTRHSIAGVVAGQGNHAEAERLYRELLPIEERVFGAEHPRTLITRRALEGHENG